MSTLTNTVPSIPESVLRAAVSAYAPPSRAYHSFSHARAVLRELDALPLARPLEVALAALFHDAIYDPRRSDNEARSADFAASAISELMPGVPVDVPRVRHLIELTARHGRLDRDALDDDARLFLDADMSILGADPATFDAYDAAIAQEYAHVPRLIFRFNRRRFLSRLLESDRIFLSDHFHQRLDAAARSNLRRTLGRDD